MPTIPIPEDALSAEAAAMVVEYAHARAQSEQGKQ